MMWLVALLIVGLLAALLLTTLRPALVFGGVFTALLVLDIVPAEQLFNNFTNTALITLVLLVLVSVVLERTPYISLLGHWCTQGSLHAVVLRTSLCSGLLSAVINNTAVVSTLMRSLTQSNHPASKLLIPLSYAAILGGITTLIGTSTNLLVNGFALNAGLPGIGFFDFTLVGLPIFAIGILVVSWISVRTLPDHHSKGEQGSQAYLLEAHLDDNSPLAGLSVEESGLRHLERLFLVEIVRKERVLSPVSPSDQLLGGDTLVFSGDLQASALLERFKGLSLSAQGEHVPADNLIQVVITPQAAIVGKTISSSTFAPSLGRQ